MAWTQTAGRVWRALTGRHRAVDPETLETEGPSDRHQVEEPLVSAPSDDDRRSDPRTDFAFSLRNLLRRRSSRDAYELAVVGTPDGLVMAASDDHDLVAEAAAHASLRLRDAPFGRFSGVLGDGRITCARFEVFGRPLVVALFDRGDRRDHEHDTFLDRVAERVHAILNEQRVRAAA